MLVQKYGGSSVGTPAKIRSVAERVARERQSGQPVVVVVSAMADTTDELLALARQVSPHPHERELDVLLSAGERISMALLSMALRDLGQEAISFTGSQAGIITDESHTRARILEIRPVRVKEELARGRVVIVAGFQGVSRAKEITTLGRGGSDTTAVALAGALEAARCEVLTDVPGIFSADPGLVPKARRYERLPLGLVHEMAIHGAQVMHARSIEFAREHDITLYVGLAHGARDGASQEVGTVLLPDKQAESLALPEVVAVTSKLLEPEEGRGATVTVVGSRVQDNAHLVAKVQESLLAAGIQPAGLTCHPQSITVFLAESPQEDLAARAVRVLHDALIQS